jgi:hypothetical protein
MPTRGNPRFVARAIRCFQLQTWPQRELVIVTLRRSEQLEALVAGDGRIRLYDSPMGLSLGDQRNLSVARAEGVFVATWDDDDCHAPERLSIAMHALLNSHAQAVFLSWVWIWIETRQRLGLSCRGVWENTMVARRSVLPAYPALERGSDTVVRQMMEGLHTLALIDQPDLYAYCYTGENTWDEQHFLNFLSAGTAEDFRGKGLSQAMDQACFHCLQTDAFF